MSRLGGDYACCTNRPDSAFSASEQDPALSAQLCTAALMQGGVLLKQMPRGPSPLEEM
jgi:hypothetical protein